MADVIQSVPDTQNNLPRYYKDISGNDSYFAQVVAVEAVVSPAKTVLTASGTVSGAGTQTVATANQFGSWVTIQNVDPVNVLYLSAVSPAVAGSSIELFPSASITLPFGVANALYGGSSSSSTAFAVIGA
jgi:hypothetical protein